MRITASALSQQVAVLEQAGHVTVTEGHPGERPRTWRALSPAGCAAFAHHLAALAGTAARAHHPGAVDPGAVSPS